MSIKITSPLEGVTAVSRFGTVALSFRDGVALTDELSDGLRAYLESTGYTVEDEGTEPEVTPLAEGGDPADYTVDEVNNHLATAEDDEWARILDAEAAGKARAGLLETSSAKAFLERRAEAEKKAAEAAGEDQS